MLQATENNMIGHIWLVGRELSTPILEIIQT